MPRHRHGPHGLSAAFADHWRRHFEPRAGERLVVAVSGGLDSMVLLALLARDGLAGEGIEVIAAHFDHGTRGEESAADGRFVAAIAERWGVEARLGRGDAPARAAETGAGPQAAARELRYRFLRETAAAVGGRTVATAHQRDDRVETVLLRIARGAGPDGLGSPRPLEVRGGIAFLRPLLPFSRAAIAAWAEATGVAFRDDPSNRSPRYPRTRIRREVLPLLREINPRVDAAVVRLSALAAADAAYLRAVVDDLLEKATVDRDDRRWRLRASRLVDQPDALLSRAVLVGWAWAVPPGSRTPGAEWVEGATAFLRGGRGGAVEAPGGGRVVRTGPYVEFRRPMPAVEDR